jgi:hypothetical protein
MQQPYTRRLKKPISDQLKSHLESRYDCRILRSIYGDGGWDQVHFTVKAFPLNPTVENLGHTPLDPGVELLLDIELSEYIIT